MFRALLGVAETIFFSFLILTASPAPARTRAPAARGLSNLVRRFHVQDSVTDLFNGGLGYPHLGFPQWLSEKVLKGKPPARAQDRYEEDKLPPLDFAGPPPCCPARAAPATFTLRRYIDSTSGGWGGQKAVS